MHLSTRILGKNVAEALAAKVKTPLLTIGRDQFFRGDLANVACFNFTAASNLSKLIETLGARDTRDVFDNVPPSALVLPRLGAISLAVLGAAFEARSIGGETPLENWFAKHRPKDATYDYITFSSLKQAEAKREIGETTARKARQTRTATRRDKAQRIRGERYLMRRGVRADGQE